MRPAMVIFTGAIFSFTAFAWQGDPMAEERYKSKYGRYTPAEEARQKALKEGRGESAREAEAAACCRKMDRAFTNSGSVTFDEARFRVKYGRNTPQAEARERADAELAAAHVRRCDELGKCKTMRAAAASQPATKESWKEAWLRSKYGRSMDVKTEEPKVLITAKPAGCEHECCNRSE